jgi:hypothetical protein
MADNSDRVTTDQSRRLVPVSRPAHRAVGWLATDHDPIAALGAAELAAFKWTSGDGAVKCRC